MNGWKQKISRNALLAFFSILLFFLLLELALRLGGFVYLLLNQPLDVIQKESEGFTIVCLGDSYTFGMGTDYSNSYPRQLERILLEKYPKGKFSIYNLAQSGSNSSYWLSSHRLVNILIKYKPNLIILMTGLNNVWNKPENYFFLKKNTHYFDFKFRQVGIFMSKLRLYKLFKILLLNLKNRIHQFEAQKEETVMDSDKSIGLAIISALKIDPVSNEHCQTGTNLLKDSRGKENKNYSFAEIEFEEAIKIDPNNVLAYRSLAFLHRLRAEYDLEEKSLKSALAIAETVKEPNDFLLEIDLELAKLYVETYKYGQAKEQIKLALKNVVSVKAQNIEAIFWCLRNIYKGDNDFLSEINNVKNTILNLAISTKDKKEICKIIDSNIYFLRNKEINDTALANDLINIILILNERNIKIVLQTYPGYTNRVFYEVAGMLRIPLVDNFLSFEEKFKTLKRQDLLVRDGHCNASGYEIIAENIYNKLIQEKIIDRYLNGQRSN